MGRVIVGRVIVGRVIVGRVNGYLQAYLGPWPLTKNLLAMGLKDGPKWA